MQPHPQKSIGGALVDVFDAALSLVKTELRLLSRRVGNVVKAKGIGVVLLLAAVAPLSLALIFLILALFYALLLVLPAWASALIIALLALVVTGVLVMLGIKRLSAEVKDDAQSSEELAREEVQHAEKQLEKAEKQTEKDHKKVEKAEEKLARAEADLRRETSGQSNSGQSGKGTSVAGTGAQATTTVYSAPSSGSASGATLQPDGIPVSTRPEITEEDRK
ncbi:phage holin family protein [Deinococcus peraridilitoris]|uniref:Phage holin family protein n=1 Tax=Deinococcus peraridilitoris (strain DSM 19664 / LMG 22246 / CIP 109416 / KR-200) TaxID=937777 RepID=L0A5Z2_DEIPD|nr:phage holin family protein [Deinococcus peraridilitoris]AFZ68582.1 Protein of unknown function (DUF1469) [Deinococcus peraridilitoris DSM 19664]